LFSSLVSVDELQKFLHQGVVEEELRHLVTMRASPSLGWSLTL
jgi:hypothetical protein